MILLPIRTVAGLNAREHHMARARRVREEREATGWALKGHEKPATPCAVTLTRISPAHVMPDDDQVVGALKGIRDAVAEWLDVDDREKAVVRYAYEQEKGPWGVRISFGPHCEGCASDGAVYVFKCPACQLRMFATLTSDGGLRNGCGA